MSLAMVGPMLGFSAALPSSVLAGSTDHFAIDTVGTQQAGTAFTVTVRALDSSDQPDTGYTGGATLSGLAASPGCSNCNPALLAASADHGGSGSWTGGVGTYSVTAYNAQPDAQLTVTDESATTPSTPSNTFTVNPATDLKGFTIANIVDQVAGTAFGVTVTAYDLYGNPNTNYSGSPTLSGLATSPGCSACDPALLATAATYGTLGSWLNGSDTVSGVLAYNAQGNAQLKVEDGSVNNVSNLFAVGPATSLQGFTFANVGTKTAGAPTSVMVTAYDLYGNVNTNYAGSMTLALFGLASSPGCTSCDPALSAATPLYGSFSWTNGQGTWSGFTPFDADTAASLTVTDGSISNTSNTFLVDNGVALGGFTIDKVVDQQAGTAFDVTVRAYDLYGNPKTDYSGGTLSGLVPSPGCPTCTPMLTATSPSYGNPGAWTNGVGTFHVKAYNAQGGAQLTITDGSVSNSSNTFTVSDAGTVAGFTIAHVNDQTAGAQFPVDVTVTAYDAYGNHLSGYAGTTTALHGLLASPGCPTCTPMLTATSPTHGNPGNWTLGVGTFHVTAYNAQSNAQLTMTDGSIHNSSNTFAVGDAGTLAGFTIAHVNDQTAGAQFPVDVTVTAYDAYGNHLGGYAGTATAMHGLVASPGCSSLDCTPAIPSASPTHGNPGSWTLGVGTFHVTAYNAQSNAQLTMTDGSIHNSSNTFTVSDAGTLAGFSIGHVNDQTAGTAFDVSVTAYDAYGNHLSGYAGTANAMHGLVASPGCSSPSCTPPIPAASPTHGNPGSWTLGIGTFQVTAYNAQAGAQLTMTDGSIHNSSNLFQVNPVSTATKLLFRDDSVSFDGRPIDTKFNEPIYSFCNPSGAVVPHPCAVPPGSTPTKVLAIDLYGNRVSGVSVTVGTSPNTTLIGTNSAPTQGGTPGVAPYGEAWFSTLSIAETNTYQLTATKTGPVSGNGTSDKFRVVQELRACSGSHQCTNNTSNGKSGNFTQYSYGQITSSGTYNNVLLTTQFTVGTDTSGMCGQNRTIGDTTELRAAGPSVSTTSTGYLLLIIPKNTLKADGVLSRGTPSFNVCLGTINLGGGANNIYGAYGSNTAPPWKGKKTSGNGLTGATIALDASLGPNMFRYWGIPALCGTAGLGPTDPCIYRQTKQKSDITALTTGPNPILAPGADANMHDSDLAIVIYKPNPWDGKGGVY